VAPLLKFTAVEHKVLVLTLLTGSAIFSDSLTEIFTRSFRAFRLHYDLI